MKAMKSFSMVYFLLCCLRGGVSGMVSSICPNGCSSHGVCANTASGGCNCFPGFTGVDCSLRVCPSSSAWVDIPSDSEHAHAEFAECSNMGECDRETGLCKCRTGFEGAACDILMCPVDTLTSSIPEGTNITAICSGNGRCISLRDVTNFQTFNTYLDYTHYTGFDADKIHGCVCEDGWGGIACEKRLCPKGDDPLTASSSGSAEEVQLIDCLCTSCQGGLYISFKGQQTPLIPFDASEELIQFRISQFSSIRNVQVKIVEGTQMCSNVGSVTKIRFILPQGPQPSISIVRGGGLRSTMMPHDISVRSKGQYSLIKHTEYSFEGARNLVECSNRGVCDYSTGMCTCFDGFRSSDGFNGNGSVPDCGYRHLDSYSYVQNGVTKYTSCPVDDNDLVCSGNGVCDESQGTCTCDVGFGASDCSLRTCLSSFAWFGNVDSEHRAASPSGLAECGGIGKCDTTTGKCTNCGGHWGVFYGDQCEYFSCPKDADGNDCSNNGACLSLYEIGLLRYNEQKELDPVVYAQNWDAHVMRGCACSRAISVDGQFDIDYNRIIGSFYFNQTTNRSQLYTDEDVHKFYRGPYAFAATDFKGYDCAQAWCPKGDNPKTFGVNEIQQLSCRADNGTFMLSFRENVTLPIDWNSTLAEFKYRLEQIFTIGAVEVTLAGATTDKRFDGHVCTTTGNNVVNIEFLTEFGDLPLMRSDISAIRNIDPHLATLQNGYIMNITEYQKGTKEDEECSGQGMCDEAVGRCACFQGFGSSNGTVDSPGNRGDCTFFNKLYTQAFV